MLNRELGHIAQDSPMRRKPKPVRFEPRWRAADASLRTAIENLIALLEAEEQIRFPRKRRRRADDLAIFHLAIEALACNLLAVSIVEPGRPLAIPLANSASQIAPIFGKPARKVIDLMVALGLVKKVQGNSYRGPTTIKPTRRLHKHLPLGEVGWNALRLEDQAQVVFLKPRPGDESDAELAEDDEDAPPLVPAGGAHDDWLSAVTAEMHAINAAIHAAPIECVGPVLAHIEERPSMATASLATPHHRGGLRRIFNGSWEEGGRLFGGFWQTMPRADRFRKIRIAGEPVALVDYSQLFLRLAYAEAGAEPPPGDLYDVTGEDALRPDWKRLRDARKRLVNALFFRSDPLKQWPGATVAETLEMREAFPPGTKPRDAIADIKRKHGAIAHLFEQGHGLRFMRQESDLIVAVTLALFKRGVVALPIHDAALVPEKHAAAAKAIMVQEALRLTGANIPADIQTGAD
jgi:hypothetical protein